MKFKLILLVNTEDSEEILIYKISFIKKKKTTEESVEILIQKIPFSKKNNCHKSVI